MVEVIRANDLLALSSLNLTELDDWIAHDYDVECPVYVFVHPTNPHPQPHTHAHHEQRNDPRCCRWSIAWPVGPGSVSARELTAWRHVQLEASADDLGAVVELHYGYFGAITKTAGPEIVAARRYKLGTTSLWHRKEIERLARLTPVLDEVEGWGCQDWVKDLLKRMVAAGIASEEVCTDIVSKACTCTSA